MAFGQDKGFRLLPEGGLSLPTGDFSAKNVFGSQGIYAGLNADYFWGKFGVGLFGGINNNDTDYTDDLPTDGSLITSRFNNVTQHSWKQLPVGLGPIYRLGLSEKFDLEFSFKVGFSKFTYPDYAESIETGAPLNQRYLKYETRNQDVKEKLSAMLRTSLNLNFNLSESIDLSPGANYAHAKGVEHSYMYLDGGFNPELPIIDHSNIISLFPPLFILDFVNTSISHWGIFILYPKGVFPPFNTDYTFGSILT
jgi:hypothetical protein